jgi:hypothetical protein
MYNINEMVSVMGKRKKMPTTLGINLRTGVILIAPERTQDGPSQEWTADKMTHYSREGKHVFLELVRPSKSVDFHAGAKDTADEIVSALGDMAGAIRAEGLKEIIMAGTNKSVRKGQVLYDFMAQSGDEVTVAAGDEVIVVDDSKSEEWWQVRRLKNGKEGVVPSSYIEVTGIMTPPPNPGVDSAKSRVDQNRMEEIRLTKEALKASKEPQQVGPGMSLPERGSSLNNTEQQQGRRQNGRSDGGSAGKVKSSKSNPITATQIISAKARADVVPLSPLLRAEPDPSKVRTWTDRSRSFSVEAQFLGLKDGKVHLHKMNGVKIAVPIAKMSRDDLEFVENMTGITLQEDKTQADTRKYKGTGAGSAEAKVDKKPEYDWFQFFLSCEVAVGLCERYAQAFHKESMDESVLPDVDAGVLRNLGLREGDIIKVMRTLDAKYDRQRPKDGDGGLFSGPGGTLRNNTRKGRPAPAVQTSDVVDATAFSTKAKPSSTEDTAKSPTSASSTPNPSEAKKPSGGFDDDAWDVKPSKQPQPPKAQSPPPAANSASPPPPNLTGSMKELSLLSEPLQPAKTASQAPPPAQPRPAASTSPTQAAAQQQPGATPSFFSTLPPPQQAQATAQASMRQRPTPPPTSLQGSLVPPPPQRPLSAPQSAQPSAFPAPGLAPQMTGAVQGQVAPPGQSLSEINQARLQQQQQQLAAQMQQPSYTGYPQPQVMAPFQTGNQAQFMQPLMTGAPSQSPFADPGRSFSPMHVQPTGYQPPFGQPPPGGINSYLPPALEPQKTGMPPMQPQATGIGGFNQPGPHQVPQPLQPQKTGPAPPVRFGVSPEPKKLAPQATGRKANLAQASKCHTTRPRSMRYPFILIDVASRSSGQPFWFLRSHDYQSTVIVRRVEQVMERMGYGRHTNQSEGSCFVYRSKSVRRRGAHLSLCT